MAAITQGIELNNGVTVSYHVLVPNRYVITEDGRLYRFVRSYFNQAAFQAGKPAIKESRILVQNQPIVQTFTAFDNAVLTELSANKVQYLEQIK